MSGFPHYWVVIFHLNTLIITVNMSMFEGSTGTWSKGVVVRIEPRSNNEFYYVIYWNLRLNSMSFK